MTSDGGLRASDRQREAAAGVLREAYVAGRLDMTEFQERIDAAYSAKTEGELHRLTADLPEGAVLSGSGGETGSYREGTDVNQEPARPFAGRPFARRPFAPVWGTVAVWLAIAAVAHVAAAIPLVLLSLFVLSTARRKAPPRRRGATVAVGDKNLYGGLQAADRDGLSSDRGLAGEQDHDATAGDTGSSWPGGL
jgi:Domain of unknown function (DUF1707)